MNTFSKLCAAELEPYDTGPWDAAFDELTFGNPDPDRAAELCRTINAGPLLKPGRVRPANHPDLGRLRR